jgi:hypothetical protein
MMPMLNLMRMFLVCMLVVVGISNAVAQSLAPPTSPADISAALRSRVFGLSPGAIGITRENTDGEVWGVVMEAGLGQGFYTLVVLADGSTSLYLSTGGGVIGAGEHEAVREASRELIAVGNRLADAAVPAASTAPPANGGTQFFLLTFDGLRSYTVSEGEAGKKGVRNSPLFLASQAVIGQVRLASRGP